MTMGSPSSQQQYCLKWNNYQNNLLRVFNRLLGSEQFTDVLLAAEGQTIRAHKVVLSACSSYFEQLFTTFNEKNQIVILKDTKYEDIFSIIEFMYKGEISVVQDQLSSLLKTAENLKVKGLAEVSSNDEEDVTHSSASPPPTQSASTPSKKATLHHQSHVTAHSLATSSGTVTDIKYKCNPNNGSGILPPSVPAVAPPVPIQNEVKRKRGRPRILDAPGEVINNCFNTTSTPKIEKINSSPTNLITTRANIYCDGNGTKTEIVTSSNEDDDSFFNENIAPTPGGPLTAERIQSLGIVKMNDYLQAGTRQQFWDEYFIKVIMQGVRNKEIDMKSAAEILGVSYGTLYGRYRETFGYLKHAWNVGGRPPKIPTFMTKDLGVSTIWADPQNGVILDQLKKGRITIKQAAELMGLEPTMLAYQLASGKREDMSKLLFEENEGSIRGDEELMEVQPDIVLNEDKQGEEGVDPVDNDQHDQSALLVTEK